MKCAVGGHRDLPVYIKAMWLAIMAGHRAGHMASHIWLAMMVSLLPW